MTAISITPITAATFNSSQLGKLHKPSNFYAKRLDFFGDFSSRKSVSWASKREKDQIIMKDLNEIGASTRDEGFEAFEQEAFMDGSLKFGDGGLEATLNSLSKWLVSVVFAATVIWRHDVEALWAAMGAVVNVVLSITLKKILNQERPISTLKSDPGMPSSHAQSFFYTITFLNLSMVELYGINALTTILSGFSFILGSYFSWLRVSQQFHTVIQVVVGGVVGSIFSALWFWSWKAFVLNAFVSSLWVRSFVVAGAVGFCIAFVVHVIRYWVADER